MKITVLIALVLFCFQLQAQNQPSKDSAGKILRARLYQQPISDDLNKFQHNKQRNNVPLKLYSDQEVTSTIVIIDDKIYRLDSYEYFNLKVDTLAEPVTIIKDNTSKAGIKKILIYKTKHN
jgi:hypothetical protein